MPRAFVALVALLTCVHLVAAACECGYVDDNGNVWNAGALAAVADDWVIATDNEPQDVAPYIAIQYTTDNAIQYNDALGLVASAYDSSGSQNSGEIFTVRDDIKYGTFRMRAVVPTEPGVVFGFFTYASDTQEQDIEFLSSDSDYYQHLYYTNQPGQLPNGDVDTDASKDTEMPGADFTAFGVHRIDWLPTETGYYYNDDLKATITKNVPTAASEVVLNVWSNGDPNFSQGPPANDAIATIQYVHLYFNSTTLTEAAFNSACTTAGLIPQCSI